MFGTERMTANSKEAMMVFNKKIFFQFNFNRNILISIPSSVYHGVVSVCVDCWRVCVECGVARRQSRSMEAVFELHDDYHVGCAARVANGVVVGCEYVVDEFSERCVVDCFFLLSMFFKFLIFFDI